MKSHPTKVRSIPVSPTGQLRADGQAKGTGSPPATPVDTQICISSRKTPVPRSFSASASPTPTHVAGFAAADMASPERKAPSSLSGGSAAASWNEKAAEASNPLDVLALLVGPTHGRKQSLVSGLPQINTQIGGHVRAASHNVGPSPALGASATRVPSLQKGAGVGARGLKSAKLDSLLDDLMGEMQVLSAEVRNESDRDSITSSASNTSPVDAVRRGRFDSMASTASTGSAHRRLGCATCGTAVSQAKGALVQAARIPRSGDLPAGIQGVEHQGRIYCVRDYRRMFPLVCPSCSLPCEASKDVSVHALDAWWHRACFNCQECRQPFPDKSFYVFEQRPYCRYDYHKLNNSLCGSCKNPIEGPCAQVYEGRFHPACFACSYCSEPLRDVYYSLEGKFLCENHVHHQKSHKNANKRRTVFGNI
ncbi:hypothetical protein GGF37_005059 [Kickxella alabastrina]|nr:hypothetical protein GGF37_005059 [Kickxella alabastrina]